MKNLNVDIIFDEMLKAVWDTENLLYLRNILDKGSIKEETPACLNLDENGNS